MRSYTAQADNDETSAAESALIKSVASQFHAQALNRKSADEEIVFAKTSVKSKSALSEIVKEGVFNAHIHERIAHPHLFSGPEEPWIYSDSSMKTTDENGLKIHSWVVTKRPNISPRQEEIIEELPFTGEKLEKVLQEAVAIGVDSRALINVRILMRNMPAFDKPFRSHPDLTETENNTINAERQIWKENRMKRLETILTPYIEELESIGAENTRIINVSGWIETFVPLSEIDLLMGDTRLRAVVSPDLETQNNGCFAEGQDNHMSLEWYLGDAGELTRLNSYKFYQAGYNGSHFWFENDPFPVIKYTTVGIAEYGKYEDDGIFDKTSTGDSRVKKKYRCYNDSCVLYSGNNIDDIEDGDDHSAGGHGSGVSSIIISNYTPEITEATTDATFLWDFCSDLTDNDRCQSFYEKTRGIAYGVKANFYHLESDTAYDNAYAQAAEDEVDILNMSHGTGSNRCNIAAVQTYLSELENAFDDGVFIVNSSGNYGKDDYKLGRFRNEVQNDCNLNVRSSRPKVFSVGGIYNKLYRYGLSGTTPYYSISWDPLKPNQSVWEITNTTSDYVNQPQFHPMDPDDYRSMRLDPLGSQSGGINVTIQNISYPVALSGIDLLAPIGGWRVTGSDGLFGQTDWYFKASSGAAPHVSGLAVLVKHWLLNEGESWINYPGRLHTVMLAMGDRSYFNENDYKFYNRTNAGDRMYGFGRVRLRLLGHEDSETSQIWSNSLYYANDAAFPSAGYTVIRPTTAPLTDGIQFLKFVMMQAEDMTNKSSTDMVSHFILRLYRTNSTYTTCPTTWETACPNRDSNWNSSSCYQRYSSSTNKDIKKVLAIESSSTNLGGRCIYLVLQKGHITNQGIRVNFFGYGSQVPDWAASTGHTCGTVQNGAYKSAYCWGNNDQGQLGLGDFKYRFSPQIISGYNYVSNISSGGHHTCFLNGILTSSQSLYCFGRNDHGQLGIGNTVNSTSPVLAASGTFSSNILSVSAGYQHTCMIRTGNQLYCWGSNRYGQLGTGDVDDRLTPTLVPGNYTSVSAGKFNTCAIGTDTRAYCWGLKFRSTFSGIERLHEMYLTLPSNPLITADEVILSPEDSGADINNASVSAGNMHVCVLKTNGQVYCWGYNRMGQTGGTGLNNNAPNLILNADNTNLYASAISTGGHSTCALKTDGTVWCWGDNRLGQLGTFTTSWSRLPQQTNLTDITSISCSMHHHCCSRKSNGNVYCWGQNDNGQLGRGSYSKYWNLPNTVTGITNVSKISAGN